MRTLIAATALVALTACGGDGETIATQGVTPSGVADAFANAGLEGLITPLPSEEFNGVAPVPKGTNGVRLLIPSLGRDSEGRIFVFDNLDELRDLKAYYDGLGGLHDPWAFANEDCGVLVQINGELPESQAREYELVVETIC